MLRRQCLDRERPGQASIGIEPLRSLLRQAPRHEAAEARYGELRAAIERVGCGVDPDADPGRTA